MIGSATRDPLTGAEYRMEYRRERHYESLRSGGVEGAGVAEWEPFLDWVPRQEGVAERGYRLVINTGRDALNTVPHLHMHMLAGRAMAWPPG